MHHGVVTVPSLPLLVPSFEWTLVPHFLVGALSCVLRASGDIITCQKIADAEWVRPDFGSIGPAIALACGASLVSPVVRAADCEELVARHMIGEALLTAHLVAVAEEAGLPPAKISGMLKNVAERSAIEEFWITDSSGHAYLTSTGVDFTFSPDATLQPQASAFWPLLDGTRTEVVQEARKREIDDRVFKYVAVTGVDGPRIVQVGVSTENLPTCN